MKFFSPTSELKELLLLQHIEKKPNTTQKEIASIIDGAPSMVNVYIDNLEEKKYLIREYKSAKLVYYNITPEGIKRKNYLLINYMRELLDLYRLAKENVEKFLKKIEEKGYSKILLYGAGDTAETILGVIRDRNGKKIEVLAVIDDDIKKQGKYILDYKIISREEIHLYNYDGIIISSYNYENKIMDMLVEITDKRDSIIKFFSI